MRIAGSRHRVWPRDLDPGRALARWCAVLAVLSGVIWGLIQPPFEGPDEPSHVAYVEAVAATGTLPRSASDPVANGRDGFPPAELALLHRVPLAPEARPSWNPVDSRLARLEAGRAGPDNGRVPNYVTANPPLYYAAAAIVARATSWLPELDRLQVLRLFSALIGGGTVFFCVLFLTEALPGEPWAWAGGGVVVALQPILGSLDGAVSLDPLLFLWSAALFWLVARIMRRGLTPRRGAAVGLVAGAGMLTKFTIAGLLPGAALGLLVVAWRQRHDSRRPAVLALILAGGVFAVLVGGWLWASVHLVGRQIAVAGQGLVAPAPGLHFHLNSELGYLWETFLPFNAPTHLHWVGTGSTRTWPLWDVYVQGLIGRFGWFEYGFAIWVNAVGAGVLVALLGLAGVWMVRIRTTIRPRLLDVTTYSVMGGGLAALVAVAGYRYRVSTAGHLEETRYLFPALPLLGALVVLAVRGAGRRFGPLLAVGVSTAGAMLWVAALLQTLRRFYL